MKAYNRVYYIRILINKIRILNIPSIRGINNISYISKGVGRLIMFWNRKEVFFGSSMQQFGEVRDILANNHIKYDYKVLNHNNSAGRAGHGSIGLNMDYAYQYYVYVHYKDYELARTLLNRYRP